MKTIELTDNIIRDIVSDNDDLASAFVDLYNVVLPVDLSQVKKLNGFPKANKETILNIIDIFCEKFDRVQVNMLWLNKGFSFDDKIKKGWIVTEDSVCNIINTDQEIDMLSKKEVEELGEDINISHDE